MSEAKPYAAACDRNSAPILEVLRRYFANRRRVLEIGSGTGQHAVQFAAALPHLRWQTSDLEGNLPGIRLWVEDARLPNLLEPLALDVCGRWPEPRFDAVFTANTLHILSWEEVCTLFGALPGVLTEDAIVAVYGPFNYNGDFTSASNAAFDATLKVRGPHMGIRDFAAVDHLARAARLTLMEDIAMPANNRTLVWQYRAADARHHDGSVDHRSSARSAAER